MGAKTAASLIESRYRTASSTIPGFGIVFFRLSLVIRRIVGILACEVRL